MNLTTDQVTNFVVTIDIERSSYNDLVKPGKPYPFRPGMSASVEILTKTVENVVSVPIQAVGTREKDKKKEDDGEAKAQTVSQTATLGDDLKEVIFIYTAGDSVNMVEVKTGIQDNDYIEILSGVKEDDEVVKGPYSAVSRKLEQGTKVKRGDGKEENDKKKEDED